MSGLPVEPRTVEGGGGASSRRGPEELLSPSLAISFAPERGGDAARRDERPGAGPGLPDRSRRRRTRPTVGEPPLPAAIGKYLVVGRFPRTGQAVVFRVVHPGLARDLVLKLALNAVEAGGRHEIIEEGKILAELKHPNLVQVYDLDFHDDRPYLVMEYIRGRNLDQLAPEGG